MSSETNLKKEKSPSQSKLDSVTTTSFVTQKKPGQDKGCEENVNVTCKTPNALDPAPGTTMKDTYL